MPEFMDGNLWWRVPGRAMICDTPWACLRATIWCHVILRWWQRDLEGYAQAAIDTYLNPDSRPR